jgi:hypothetical protein
MLVYFLEAHADATACRAKDRGWLEGRREQGGQPLGLPAQTALPEGAWASVNADPEGYTISACYGRYHISFDILAPGDPAKSANALAGLVGRQVAKLKIAGQ